MKGIDMISLRKVNDTGIYLFTSVIVTLFLFYIDEGYYSFQWMISAGNWIVFVIYVSIFLVTQLGFNLLSDKILSSQTRRALSLLIGIPIGMIFLILVFYQSLGK